MSKRNLIRWLFALAFVGLCSAACAQPDLGPRAVACPMCGVDLRTGFDFVIGAGMLAALVWALAWMESATLPTIAEHLFGIGITAFVMFLFLKFLLP